MRFGKARLGTMQLGLQVSGWAVGWLGIWVVRQLSGQLFRVQVVRGPKRGPDYHKE